MSSHTTREQQQGSAPPSLRPCCAGVPIGAIVGGCVGGAVVLLGIGAGAYYGRLLRAPGYMQARKKRQAPATTSTMTTAVDVSLQVTRPTVPVVAAACPFAHDDSPWLAESREGVKANFKFNSCLQRRARRVNKRCRENTIGESNV